MTKITYIQLDKSFALTVKGHAGYAEYGNDIVCSAISMLTQTLVAHMSNVADDFEARVREGDVFLYAAGYKAIAAADTILTGFKLLAENFPDYVSLEERVS